MSSDLIALVVAGGLGAAVVVLGLTRNLSQTTRDGLPRFGGDRERPPTLGMYEGEERRRRPLSPRERRWTAALYLLMALGYASFAFVGEGARGPDLVLAAGWVLGALWMLKPRRPT